MISPEHLLSGSFLGIEYSLSDIAASISLLRFPSIYIQGKESQLSAKNTANTKTRAYVFRYAFALLSSDRIEVLPFQITHFLVPAKEYNLLDLQYTNSCIPTIPVKSDSAEKSAIMKLDPVSLSFFP